MSYSPQNFDEIVESEKKFIEFTKLHGDPKNEWHKLIFSWGDLYIHYPKDIILEGARSTSELPEGAKVTTTFDLRSNEREYTTKFQKAVTDMENEFPQALSLNQIYETIDSPMPYDLRPTFLKVLYDNLKNQIINLRKSVEACKPEYNSNKVLDFRNWVSTYPDTIVRAKPELVLNINQDQLKAFVDHLLKERQRYCADAILVGSVKTIYDICITCANEVYKKSSTNTRSLDAEECFSKLAIFIANNKEPEPLQNLCFTIELGLKMGYVNELLTIVSKYQSIVDKYIKAAIASEIIDKSLDNLYYAIPLALGARTVLHVLNENEEILDESKKSQVKGSFRFMDETLVRLVARPFISQIADFEGRHWNWNKQNIAIIKRTRDENVAKIYMENLVFRHLIYPESFIPKLLEET